MNNLQRSWEILLLRQFNDGQPVPDDLFAHTILELRKRFRAVSSERQVIRGIWEHAEAAYRDELIRVFVDVADKPENREFTATTGKSAHDARLIAAMTVNGITRLLPFNASNFQRFAGIAVLTPADILALPATPSP
jgi:hypothetical protein